MTLIISNESDLSTNQVINWLNYFKSPFVRINPTTRVTIKKIVIASGVIDTLLEICDGFETKELSLASIKSFWYRRGNFQKNIQKSDAVESVIKQEISTYLSKEYDCILNFLHQINNFNKNYIGNYFDNNTNKLFNLVVANSVGLDIPNTLVTTESAILIQFFKNNTALITKAINNGGAPIPKLNFQFGAGTHEVFIDSIDKALSFPSLFQSLLEKDYELRVFHLKGRNYASAIFSQFDEKTKIDFRNYNDDKPNRVVPYSLPSDINKKINKLMIKLNMNCGSIDIVVTKDKKYVFLEINPIGQFSQVSLPCNYFLEKVIAKKLTLNGGK